MRKLSIFINDIEVDLPQSDELGLRFQRIVRGESDFTLRGGDFSLSLTLPATPKNERLFGNKQTFFQIKKFGEKNKYQARISNGGESLLTGIFKLEKVSKKGYEGSFVSLQTSFLSDLGSKTIQELGYVDGAPTWFSDYYGMTTANNSAINLSAGYHPLHTFPEILYNNTPITDFLDYTYDNVFGINALQFPNVFPANPAHFSYRFGTTFEDFPPATNYYEVLKRIFNELGYDIKGEVLDNQWFRKLYMPYVGDGFAWNWGTLAQLNAKLDNKNFLTFGGYKKSVFSSIYNTNKKVEYAIFSPISYDLVSQRLDYVANFKKFNAGDTLDDCSYIVPTDGLYSLTISSKIFTRIDNFSSDDPLYAAIGQGTPASGYGDGLLVLVRENQNGDPVLAANWQLMAADFLAGNSTDFITEPSDVVAYVSPKKYLGTTPSNAYKYGSPLTNFEQNPLILNVLQSETSGIGFTESTMSATISINVNLQKNERIKAYWVVLGGVFVNSSPHYQSGAHQLYRYTNTQQNTFAVGLACADSQINVAKNLPKITQKDFISSFLKLFNLGYRVDELAKSISFFSMKNSGFLLGKTLDLTPYVDADSLTFRPLAQPLQLRLGWNNDGKDRLLAAAAKDCDNSATVVGEYGNVVENNNSPYADGNTEIRLPFSATRFQSAKFDLAENPSFAISFVSNFNYPNGDPFYQGIATNLLTTSETIISIPNIQTQTAFEQTTVGVLEYNWNYAPRLLYVCGLASATGRYLVGAPSDHINSSNYWKFPVFSSFDYENYWLYGASEYPSLRFDKLLYPDFYNSQKENWENSHILECDVYIDSQIWNELEAKTTVLINGDAYNLLQISQFDPEGGNPATLTLQKIV